MRYSFGRLVLFAAAVAVYLLSWYGLGACFDCLPLFICCLGAVLVLSTAAAAAVFASAAAVAHFLLSWWWFIVLIWCYPLLLQASTVGCLGKFVLVAAAVAVVY
ncbi:hypothetical protein MAM1_0127d06027 [Mucor ambiguus]|uniref:Uncharacterized protein n=1 Tax=Mucor ambiguus TaxID=91626 RepID=A0A0C9MWK7_9FUNG|nr:hypothetical protein MAM1_0127d06027 [Mucor ambiguus]